MNSNSNNAKSSSLTEQDIEDFVRYLDKQQFETLCQAVDLRKETEFQKAYEDTERAYRKSLYEY